MTRHLTRLAKSITPASFRRSTLRSRTPEEKAAILAGLVKDVYPSFEARTFAPFVHKVMPIAEATEGHAILERGENRGKVVLTVN